MPIAHLDRAARRALDVGLATGADEVLAVHVCDTTSPGANRQFEREWDEWDTGVTIVFLEGRAHDLADPIVDYLRRNHPRRPTTVVVSHERDNRGSRAALLTIHHANLIENAFRKEPNVTIAKT